MFAQRLAPLSIEVFQSRWPNFAPLTFRMFDPTECTPRVAMFRIACLELTKCVFRARASPATSLLSRAAFAQWCVLCSWASERQRASRRFLACEIDTSIPVASAISLKVLTIERTTSGSPNGARQNGAGPRPTYLGFCREAVEIRTNPNSERELQMQDTAFLSCDVVLRIRPRMTALLSSLLARNAARFQWSRPPPKPHL